MTAWSGVRADSGTPRSQIDSDLVSVLREIGIVTSSCPVFLDYDFDSDASSDQLPLTATFFSTLSTFLAALIRDFPTWTLSSTYFAFDSCSVFSRRVPFLF